MDTRFLLHGIGASAWGMTGTSSESYPPPQGDGNIRYYEVSADKPYLNYLTEYRSYHPQKGIGECGAPRPLGVFRDRDEADLSPTLGREEDGESTLTL